MHRHLYYGVSVPPRDARTTASGNGSHAGWHLKCRMLKKRLLFIDSIQCFVVVLRVFRYTGSRLRPKTLQAVDVPIIDNRQCERWHKSNGINVIIYDEMMCAGYREGSKDSCQVSKTQLALDFTPTGFSSISSKLSFRIASDCIGSNNITI